MCLPHIRPQLFTLTPTFFCYITHVHLLQFSSTSIPDILCPPPHPPRASRGSAIHVFLVIIIKQATVIFWLTYSKSNQASKERKKPKCVRESCYKAKYRNDGSRYVNGDFPAKLVAKWTHCNSSHKEANEYHRRSNSTVQAPLTYQVKLLNQKRQCKHVSGRAYRDVTLFVIFLKR